MDTANALNNGGQTQRSARMNRDVLVNHRSSAVLATRSSQSPFAFGITDSRRSNCRSSQQAEQVHPSLNLALESDRLLTFDERWDNPNIETAELAHWGWFYTGTRDLVKTFCCGIRLQEWQSDDKPFEWHTIKRPTCPFILGALTAAAEENSQGIQPRSPRVSSGAGFGVKSTKTANNWDVEENEKSRILLARLGVFIQKPRHTQYATYQSRVSSFERWPRTKTQTAEDLAIAGLFYTGLVDRVLCFHCNLALHNWQPNMIPYEEHAKWAGTRCEFLNMCNGKAGNLATLQGGSSGTSQDDGPIEADENVNGELVAAVEETLSAHTIEELEYKIPSWKGHENVRTMMDMGYDARIVGQAVITNDFQIFDEIDHFVERTEFLLSVHNNRANDGGQTSDAFRSNTKLSANAQRQNREAQICKICYDSELCVAFLPCSHLVCCTKCSPALTQCPICRKEAVARVRVYLT